MIVQKLKKVNEDSYQMAESYYSLISSLNNLKLTQREIQLVAHTAIHGNISYAQVKEELCSRHETSIQTINNIISRLKKINVLVKDNGKVRVHPALAIKFDNDVVLQIFLLYGQAH